MFRTNQKFYLLLFLFGFSACTGITWPSKSGLALLRAANRGDVGEAKQLVAKGVNVNEKNSSGATPLIYAAQNGYATAIDVLLKTGANPNAQESYGWTALIEASARGDIKSVTSLLNHGANINLQEKKGQTALHLAATNGYTEVVKALLDAGADMDIIDGLNGWTPFLYAVADKNYVKNDRHELIKTFINHGVDINSTKYAKDKTTPLTAAAQIGVVKSVGTLIDHNADVNLADQDGNGWTPLMAAASNNRLDIVWLFLNAGADIDAQRISKDSPRNGWTALMHAVEYGYLSIVQKLLNKGAHVYIKDSRGQTASMLARSKGYSKIAGLLEKKEALIKKTVLMSAREGWTAAIQHLLTKGVDANTKDNNFHTALMFAAQQGHIDTMQALIDKGADVNAKNNKGNTALIIAADNVQNNTLQTLLDKGANVNAKNRDGWTALMYAAYRNNISIVQALLDKGADVNAKHKGDSTALMIAASKGNTSIVHILLTKGADVNAKDNTGKTALMYATMVGHTETVQLLKKAGETQETKKEVSFTLNRQTVSSVKPAKTTFGYGLQIKLSDYGWNQIQQLLAEHPGSIILMSKGTVLSREVLLNGSFSREFFWIRSTGTDELSKEQAEILTQQILGNGANVHAKDKRGQTASMLVSAKGASYEDNAPGKESDSKWQEAMQRNNREAYIIFSQKAPNNENSAKLIDKLAAYAISRDNYTIHELSWRMKKNTPSKADITLEAVSGAPKIALAKGDLEYMLDPKTGQVKSWNWGPGARHTLLGTLEIGGYKFLSDTQNPLVFQMVWEKGYVYLSGKGIIITL